MDTRSPYTVINANTGRTLKRFSVYSDASIHAKTLLQKYPTVTYCVQDRNGTRYYAEHGVSYLRNSI